ncbi:MAG: LysM peptidoglycan-binding domain-containing protein [Pseudomonadota bacterium]
MATRPISGSITTGTRPTESNTHTVRRGENLTSIARKHDISVDLLREANPQLRNPDLLQVGQVLHLPQDEVASASDVQLPGESAGSTPPQGDSYYTVRPGDNLSRIARSHGVGLSDLIAANPQLHDPDTLHPDDQLRLPLSASGRGALGALNASADLNAAARSDTRVDTYTPHSERAVALFREAAHLAGVPESWASSPALHNLLQRESRGRVGVPNYTYGRRASNPARWPEIHAELRRGRRTARSSATGLGQLLLKNVDRYYPAGRAGIGDPVQEAAGMLAYIKDRYGTPENAWRQYGRHHEGY